MGVIAFWVLFGVVDLRVDFCLLICVVCCLVCCFTCCLACCCVTRICFLLGLLMFVYFGLFCSVTISSMAC